MSQADSFEVVIHLNPIPQRRESEKANEPFPLKNAHICIKIQKIQGYLPLVNGKFAPCEGSLSLVLAAPNQQPCEVSYHKVLPACEYFLSLFSFFFSFCFFFLGRHPRHMEIPRLGVQLEL